MGPNWLIYWHQLLVCHSGFEGKTIPQASVKYGVSWMVIMPWYLPCVSVFPRLSESNLN